MGILVLSIGSLLVFSLPVYAYLDPGSGSMLLQLILGGIAGLAVVVKLYWRRFLSWIGIRKRESDKN